MFPTKAPGGGNPPARPSGLRWKSNLRGRKWMKKKLLSLALALVLGRSLAVPAFAAENDFTIEYGRLIACHGVTQ